MKVINCYVENFGKLSQFSYNFNDGLNIIEEDNGWGKSTLAAFIKAMFYSLEYHRGKKLTDRKLYSPWNEKQFGGYLIFEKDGTEYKIERFFGRTKKYDTVTVYNMSRNTVTDELGDNPGEAIWGVDRDSYEKTAFITLDDSSLLNDIISSKLGNIEDQEADLETSTQAIDLLDKELVRIKARRGKNGLLGKKEKVLTGFKKELRQYQDSLKRMEKTEGWLEKEEKELKEVNKKIGELEEEQSKLVLYEKKRQYMGKLKDFEDKSKEYDKEKTFFEGKSLSKEELDTIEEEKNKCLNKQEQASKISLSDKKKKELQELKDKFSEDETSLKEIEDYNEKISKLSNKKIELKKYIVSDRDKVSFKELEKKYKYIDIDRDTMDGYLDDFNQVSELIEDENKIKNEIEELKQEKRSRKEDKSKKSPMLFIGLSIFTFGLILLAIVFILGLITTLAGATIIVYSFMQKSKDKKEDSYIKREDTIENLKKNSLEVERKRKEMESGYLSFIELIDAKPLNLASLLANSKVDIIEYNRLKDIIEENILEKEKLDSEISNLKMEIETYLKKYYSHIEGSDYNKILSDLRDDLYNFKELFKAENSYKEIIKSREEAKEILEEKLGYYYKDFPDDINYAVEELKNKYYSLQRAKDRLDEAKERKESFKGENDIADLDKLNLEDEADEEKVAYLSKEKKDLNEEANELIKKIEGHKKDINNFIAEVDKIEDIESEIVQTEKDIERLKKEHNLLNLTKECMVEAKENLAEKYMGHMSSNFKKYLGKLNNGKTEKYQIDINLDIKVEDGGKLYKKDQLSSGMKDLVQLCLRMALVESIYKDVDNPILVLDDPFINLDNNRLQNAIDLLKEISLDYQIIYFICHSSRNV